MSAPVKSIDRHAWSHVRLSRCALTVALLLALPVAIASEARGPSEPAGSIVVQNCDDSGPGSLRDAVASAASGDTIDLSNLTCSTITLTSGAIEIPQDDLYLKYSGEGGTPPTIDGNVHGRVFHHTGIGTLKLVGLTIENGKYDNTYTTYPVPASGGCIYSSGNVYLGGSSVAGCTARDTRSEDAGGGALYVVGTLTMNYAVVSASTAYSTSRFADGGDALAHGNANVYFSTISGGYASGVLGSDGGGLTVIALTGLPSTIANTTIDGNLANRGAGLWISGGGTGTASVSITNSTVSGNTANSSGSALYSRGPLTLTATTIAFNHAGGGPAVEIGLASVPVQIESSIVAQNDDGVGDYDIGSGGTALTIAGSHDLIVDVARDVVLPADTLTSDPLLQPLADNGGPTRTHALGEGSPAIDTGDNSAALAFDQRGNGFARVVGVTADIGAYETQSDQDTIFADGFDGVVQEKRGADP